MAPPFSLQTTPRFERLARRLAREHREFRSLLEEVIEILETDPYNRSRRHPIKKLEGVPRGEGQYRLRMRRFRFRYDVYRDDVVLHRCSLRAEDTYR